MTKIYIIKYWDTCGIMYADAEIKAGNNAWVTTSTGSGAGTYFPPSAYRLTFADAEVRVKELKAAKIVKLEEKIKEIQDEISTLHRFNLGPRKF